MKNILVCACDYDLGSSGAYHFSHYILELNDRLNSPYRVWLLTEDIDKNKGQRNEKIMAYIQKVPFDYPCFLFPLNHFLRNWAYFWAIRRFKKEQNIDAVIFSQAFFGVLARLLLPKNIKIAGIIHDPHSLAPNRSSHYSAKSFWYYQVMQRPLEMWSNHILDYTIANSDYIRQLILSKRGLSPEKVPLIYQSIDVSKIVFRPQNWVHTEAHPVKILFVKSAFINGGLQELIAALGLLSYKFELTIVGSNLQFKPQFEDWANVFSNISLNCIGHQAQSEVSKLMYSHQILCIPSRHEALGLANVEGLAHGISVVSTNVGGIPEVLDNGRCGWQAEPQNPESLAFALKNCIESAPSVRLEKSQFGRQHVEKLFSKEIMLNQILDLLPKMTN